MRAEIPRSGWSASTAVRMISEVYGHVGLPAKQRAMVQVEQFMAAQRKPSGVGTELGTIEDEKILRVQ